MKLYNANQLVELLSKISEEVLDNSRIDYLALNALKLQQRQWIAKVVKTHPRHDEITVIHDDVLFRVPAPNTLIQVLKLNDEVCIAVILAGEIIHHRINILGTKMDIDMYQLVEKDTCVILDSGLL